jgi:excinuclease ABC subunit A
VPARRRRPIPGLALRIRGATANNLKDLDVEIPLSRFVAVTGVSGSGKSTLIETCSTAVSRSGAGSRSAIPGACRAIDGADRVADVILVDQAPIGSTPRANR